MTYRPDWLPPMVDVNGEWGEVVESLYAIFEADFKEHTPQFEDWAVWWDRRVLPGEQYEEGFWHLVTRTERSSGHRLPDFRRAERLPWCGPTIRYSGAHEVRVWDYQEGNGKPRTYLWLVDLDYVVILQKRKTRTREVAFLITAYHVDGESTRRSLRRKYAERVP